MEAFAQFVRIIPSLGIIFLITSCAKSDVENRQSKLLESPLAKPSWLLDVGPEPGQVLSVDDAWYGESEGPDPFWPGYGPICVQIDGGITEIKYEDVSSHVKLELNGKRVRMIKRLGLLHGAQLVDGIILYSEAEEAPIEDAFNACLAMDLAPGDYLASGTIKDQAGNYHSYDWSFKLSQ